MFMPQQMYNSPQTPGGQQSQAPSVSFPGMQQQQAQQQHGAAPAGPFGNAYAPFIGAALNQFNQMYNVPSIAPSIASLAGGVMGAGVGAATGAGFQTQPMQSQSQSEYAQPEPPSHWLGPSQPAPQRVWRPDPVRAMEVQQARAAQQEQRAAAIRAQRQQMYESGAAQASAANLQRQQMAQQARMAAQPMRRNSF
jgi:hypothetical protein